MTPTVFITKVSGVAYAATGGNLAPSDNGTTYATKQQRRATLRVARRTSDRRA